MARGPYPCIRVIASPGRAEDLPWVLRDLGADAVELRDEDTMTAHPEGAVLLIAGFPDTEARDAALEVLSAAEPDLEAGAVHIEDDGWNAGWKSFFRPVVLERIQVITPWMEPPREDRRAIVIDPGLAFGTGGHATTRLILGMLEDRWAAERIPPRVLDVGTGSGILAIAASMMGAREVLGIDIDPESAAAVLDNAAANGVGGGIVARVGEASGLEGAWPLVLANIEIGVFSQCARDIAARVESGGEALLSGLLDSQVRECLSLWPGFELTERRDAEGWSAIAVRRPR